MRNLSKINGVIQKKGREFFHVSLEESARANKLTLQGHPFTLKDIKNYHSAVYLRSLSFFTLFNETLNHPIKVLFIVLTM